MAVREAIMASGHGRADYLLYVDKRVVGVIESKPVGTTLAGVEWQSATYADGLRPEVRLKALTHDGRLPFVFEASGIETWFTNGFDPDARARRLFSFPRPEALAQLIRDADADPAHPTWRAKVRTLPPLDTTGPASGPDRGRPGRRTILGRAAVRSVADPDGDGRRQDLHRGHTGVSPARVRRVPAHPVPGRPDQPGQADAGRVPELPNARRRPAAAH